MTAAPSKVNFVQALNTALHEAMTEDESIIVLGEDVADAQGGGVVKVTQGLSTRFGDARVRYLIDLAPSQRTTSSSKQRANLVPIADAAKVRSLLRQGYVGEEVVFVDERQHFRLVPAKTNGDR